MPGQQRRAGAGDECGVGVCVCAEGLVQGWGLLQAAAVKSTFLLSTELQQSSLALLSQLTRIRAQFGLHATVASPGKAGK